MLLIKIIPSNKLCNIKQVYRLGQETPLLVESGSCPLTLPIPPSPITQSPRGSRCHPGRLNDPLSRSSVETAYNVSTLCISSQHLSTAPVLKSHTLPGSLSKLTAHCHIEVNGCRFQMKHMCTRDCGGV